MAYDVDLESHSGTSCLDGGYASMDETVQTRPGYFPCANARARPSGE